MAVRIQPQRVPLGTVMLGGRPVPVTITVEWYRVLQALAGDVGTVVDDADNSDEDSLELGIDSAGAVHALAAALDKAVSALASDSEVAAMRARIGQLEARLAALEVSPAQSARIAQLEARISGAEQA